MEGGRKDILCGEWELNKLENSFLPFYCVETILFIQMVVDVEMVFALGTLSFIFLDF